MATYEYSSNYVPAAPVCQVYLGAGGQEPGWGPLDAILDTGADISVVPSRHLRRIGAPSIGDGQAHSLWGDTRTVRVYVISLRVETLTLKALRVLADDEGNEVILGRIVLNRLKIVLDGPAAMLDILIS